MGSIVQVYVVVIGTSGVLAVLIIGVESTLDAAVRVNLVQRWVSVLVVIATVFMLRRRLLTTSRVMAGKFADSLTRLSIHNAGYVGGAVGMNLTAPEDMAARSWATRRVERHVARRSLRNLEKMERTRERGTLNYEKEIPQLPGGVIKDEWGGGGGGGGGRGGGGGGRHRRPSGYKGKRRADKRGNPRRPSGYKGKRRGSERGRHAGNPSGGRHRSGRSAGRAGLARPPAGRRGAPPAPTAGGRGGARGGGMPANKLTVTMKTRAPRSPFRTPTGAVSDRVRLWRDRRELKSVVRRAQNGRQHWP